MISTATTSGLRVLLFSACLAFTLPAVLVSCGNAASNKEQSALNDESGIPVLLEREGELAKAQEWPRTKEKAGELRKKAINNPNDVKSRLQLATIYMSEARITGNSYYHQASVKLLDNVIAIQPENFEAYTYKASIAMSLHQFADAKKLAEKARSINPDNAYVCGVLVDAYVELGNYKEAIAMSDKMQELKPSLESYARASYLREIYGDYPGAIQAMKMAVQAGAAGTESGEWARVTLGDLYLNTGMLDTARMLYETTLSLRPDFPNAEIGLAKVEQAEKNYDSAIKHTENAIKIVSEVAYVSLLGELYEQKGDDTKANEIRKDVIKLLEEGEKEQKNNLMPHNGNRELAQAYLEAGDYDKAITFAKNDLELRPQNIDANELLAWIYYKNGDYATATIHADKMLATNSMNADKLYKAGLIYTKANDKNKGSKYSQMSGQVNPYHKHSLIAAK